MPSALTFYKAGSVISAAFVAAAIGLDFKNEHDANRQIAALSTPMMDRFKECQTIKCGTERSTLVACAEEKADQMAASINAVVKAREDNKTPIRVGIFLAVTIFSFFGLMAWTEPKSSVKPPQPR